MYVESWNGKFCTFHKNYIICGRLIVEMDIDDMIFGDCDPGPSNR